MRFTSAVAFAAATAPVAVSGKGTFGYSLGVRNPKGDCKSQADFEDDFKVLKDAAEASGGPSVEVVRTYSAVDGGLDGGPLCYVPSALLPAAQKFDIKVLLGLWADDREETTAFDRDVQEVLKIEEKYRDTIYAFTVGSEGLYRYEQSENKTPRVGYNENVLLEKINTFKKAIQGWNKKVGTADSWGKFYDGTADVLISGGVDLLLVNAFAFWQGEGIQKAPETYLKDLQQAYQHIQEKAGSTTAIELWNGETGWPSDGGPTFKQSIAGTAAAQTHFSEAVCAALDWEINVFYFSAFSEPWKPVTKGDRNLGETEDHVETRWGAFDADKQPILSDLSCKYSGDEQAELK